MDAYLLGNSQIYKGFSRHDKLRILKNINVYFLRLTVLNATEIN